MSSAISAWDHYQRYRADEDSGRKDSVSSAAKELGEKGGEKSGGIKAEKSRLNGEKGGRPKER